MIKMTSHTIVKNEDQFIKFALLPWEPNVSDMLVFDNSSTDKTVKEIESIKSAKIKLEIKNFKNPEDLTNARNEMLSKTKTDWFLILDGDEVWDKKTIKNFLAFLKKQPKSVWAVGMRTKNAVGDIHHYLDDSSGHYEILGKKGHLNIRAYRKLKGFSWQGNYPNEYYADNHGKSINNQDSHLAFFDGKYFHFTNLNRSSKERSSMGRKPVLWEKGELITDIPHELKSGNFKKRGLKYEALATILTPIKHAKRHLVK